MAWKASNHRINSASEQMSREGAGIGPDRRIVKATILGAAVKDRLRVGLGFAVEDGSWLESEGPQGGVDTEVEAAGAGEEGDGSELQGLSRRWLTPAPGGSWLPAPA